MKKFSIFACSIMLLIGCTNQNSGDLEKRIATLEKSSAVKDKQIAGLSYLAYFSAVDSATTNGMIGNKIPEKFFKENSLARPTKCVSDCNKAYNIAFNRCRHLSPQNRDACLSKADLDWEACTVACNQHQ
jgi:hypothetical protein